MASALSRRRFIELAGSSVATAALLAACSDSSASIDTSEFGEGETGVLNFALTLEHVNAAFYAALVEAKVLSKAGQELAEEFAGQENEHVAILS